MLCAALCLSDLPRPSQPRSNYMLFTLKDNDGAEKLFREALKHHPLHARSLQALARLYIKTHHKSEEVLDLVRRYGLHTF